MSNAPNSPIRTLLAVAAFLFVLIPVSIYFAMHVGAVGEIDAYHWGLADFRDAGYYPAQSARHGVNPYDVEAHLKHSDRKVHDVFPLYTPLTIILFFPLTFLSFHAAGAVYTAINLGLLLLCTFLSLRWCNRRPTLAALFGTAALVLASQPAQTNMNFGQFTWALVLGSYIGLADARRRPLLSGAGLALASFKPTYAVIFGFLMLWRGDYRAVIYGIVFSTLGALAGFLLMAACGVDVLSTVEVIVSNQSQAMANPQTHPSVTSLRVDLPVFLAKVLGVADDSPAVWIAPIALLCFSGWLIRRDVRHRPENASPASLNTMLLCLSAMLGIYRIAYDVLILTLPILALFLSDHPSWRRIPRWGLMTLRGLSLLLAYNFLWTGVGIRLGNLLRSRLPEALLPSTETAWHFATLMNPLLLTTMWCLVAVFVYRQSRREDSAAMASV